MRMRKCSLDNHTTDVLLCGLQLRDYLYESGMIRNRVIHGNAYTNCFVGCEVAGRLTSDGFMPSRQAARIPMQTLMRYGMIHCLEVDDNGYERRSFRDRYWAYSFRLDDGTFTMTEEADMVITAYRLHKSISAMNEDSIVVFVHGNHMYPNAVMGDMMTSCMENNDPTVKNRQEAIQRCQCLLNWSVIGNVIRPEYPWFIDSQEAGYQFRLDLVRTRPIASLLVCCEPEPKGSASTSSRSTTTNTTRKASTTSTASACSSTCGSSWAGDSGHSPGSVCSFGQIPAVTNQVTADELKHPKSPFVRQRLHLVGDPLGFGFIIRGDSPAYVQCVDPEGPAAKGGCRARQYIARINGKNCLRMHSRDVKKLIANKRKLDMIVYVHRRDRDKDFGLYQSDGSSSED